MGLFLQKAVSALCAAEFGIRFLCNEYLVTVLAQFHRVVFICQQEAEHHMNSQHERVKVPYNRRLFIKCNMVCGCIAAEGCHAHLHGITLLYRHPVIVQIIEKRIGHIEGPVLKLVYNPVIGFCILSLEAHLHSHRLLGKCHRQGYHHSVLIDIPERFYTGFDQIQFFKGIEEIQVIHGLHRLFTDVRIFRQIKADNALFRELKATVKKLMQAVKNTLPAMAEKLETLRQNMIIFRYQLLHIATGKSKMNKRLNVLRPELECYLKLAKRIKDKAKQRNLLLDERKAVPVWNLAKRQDLAKQIATLAEDIEELRSEKSMLLRSLDCADDTAMGDVKKGIAAMEAALKKLDEQESKYSAELESALQQYRKLETQIAEFDADELMNTRLELRPDMDSSTVVRIQTAYESQYSPFTMAEARQDVSNMLKEHEEEPRSVRERLRKQQEQITLFKKENDWDR